VFRNILVPVDLTDKSLDAIASVAELAAASGGRVVLLHVIETIEDAEFADFETFYDRLERKAKARLGSWVERLAGEGVEAGYQVAYGRRSEQILRCAGEQAVDLIVVSSHQVDPERPGRGWGTLSYQVAILASCPVLLVK
jgi:nucleotide-binding universal stress UspA family protein